MRKHYPLNSNGDEDAGQMPWTDGVPSTGAQGSYPGHAIVTDAESEILSAIDASGQDRNGANLSQVAAAIGRGLYLGQFGGTANALTATIPNSVVFPSLLRGLRFGGFVSSTNTAGVTVAITGIGTASGTQQAPLLRKDGSALQAGDLPVGQDFDIRWDGSAFRYTGITTKDTPAQTPIGRGLYAKQVAGTYTWTVPDGVYWVYGTVVGGGGGASGGPVSSSASSNGGGGGAGGAAEGWFAVTPGQVITFVVGAGGAGSAWQSGAATGGSSSIAGTGMTATGGGGAGGNPPAGGPGGQGSGGQTNIVGGNGGDGSSVNALSPGGAGGASILGGGGRTSSFYLAASSNGHAPGSGGGGTYTNNQNAAGASGGQGGNGADGYVSFQY